MWIFCGLLCSFCLVQDQSYGKTFWIFVFQFDAINVVCAVVALSCNAIIIIIMQHVSERSAFQKPIFAVYFTAHYPKRCSLFMALWRHRHFFVLHAEADPMWTHYGKQDSDPPLSWSQKQLCRERIHVKIISTHLFVLSKSLGAFELWLWILFIQDTRDAKRRV